MPSSFIITTIIFFNNCVQNLNVLYYFSFFNNKKNLVEKYNNYLLSMFVLNSIKLTYKKLAKGFKVS